jgi:hypothetical protein
VERFDHDPQLAEVVAPHVLEELGIVLALDPDAARLRDAGPGRTICRERARCGHLAGGRSLLRRADEGDGPSFVQEPARLPGEVSEVLLAIAQRECLVVPPHDVADEAARPILDHEPHRDLDGRVLGRLPALGEVVEDVALVSHATVECATGTGTGRGTSNRHGENCRFQQGKAPSDRRPHDGSRARAGGLREWW